MNTLTRIDVPVFTTKRPGDFETDMPQQSNRFKSTPDDVESATLDSDEEEQEVDDYLMANGDETDLEV